ncbi:MAG: outer membrane beta-barrel protein [Mongoliitalea sp.]
MRFLLICLLLVSGVNSFAQKEDSGSWEFSGYLETYYSFDFNRPDNHQRPHFLYNFNRHNEFSVNLALVKASYTEGNIRSSLALMAGTYAQYNLADEPAWAQFLNEASIGVQLLDKLWLDVGIMPSHIGFESWIGTVGWHLSRSLMAENSPYFLTGARLSYDLKEHTQFTFWLSNGWQNVQRTQNNQGVGLGFGVNHSPIKGMVINYANYLGNESTIILREMRFFNNFYIQHELDSWGYTIGFDYGMQQVVLAPRAQWWGVTASLKKTVLDKYTAAIRTEYYSDPRAIILDEPFKLSGNSINLDIPLNDRLIWRMEGRQFWARQGRFPLRDGSFSRNNLALTSSLALSF